MPKDLVSTTEEKVPIRINPTTSTGKPAQLDGQATLSITSGNATVAQATAEEIAEYEANGKPGLVGFVISEDTPGTSTYQVSGDADLGEGVTNIVDGGTYTYNNPFAANLGLDADVAVPK